MPYKRVGKKVMVKSRKKWRTLKNHKSIGAAEKHLKALRINVKK